MTHSDKKDIFYQLIFLVLKTRELVSKIKDPNLTELVKEIETILDKYYFNFDACPDCGCPIPSVPNLREKNKIMPVINKYLKLYELTTGIDVEEFIIKKPESIKDMTKEESVPEKSKLVLDPRLSKLGDENKIKTIKGKLISMG
jgi:hypothetical protein